MSIHDVIKDVRWEMREACDRLVRRLHYQPILKALARRSKTQWIRAAAMCNLTDQTLLTQFALHGETDADRANAVLRLADRSLVISIVTGPDDYVSVRSAAISRLMQLGEMAVVAQIAKSDRSNGVRERAIHALKGMVPSNQEVLTDIAINGRESFERQLAIEGLTDYDALGRIILTTSDPAVRSSAIYKIGDSHRLFDLATRTSNLSVCKELLSHFSGRVSQHILRDALLNSPDSHIREVAFMGITYISLVQEILTSLFTDETVKQAARKRLEELQREQAARERVPCVLILKNGAQPANDSWYVDQIMKTLASRAMKSPSVRIRACWRTGHCDVVKALFMAKKEFGDDIIDQTKYETFFETFSDADGDGGAVLSAYPRA